MAMWWSQRKLTTPLWRSPTSRHDMHDMHLPNLPCFIKSPANPRKIPIKSSIFMVKSTGLCFFHVPWMVDSPTGLGLHECSGRCHMQLGCGPVVNVMEWGSKTNHFAGKVVGISWDIYIYCIYNQIVYKSWDNIYIYIYKFYKLDSGILYDFP